MSNNSQKAIALLVIIMTTATPVLAFDNATIICTDNVTLTENITVYKDGNSSWVYVSSYCVNGCDNVSIACNPSEYQQDLINYFVIVVFGVIIIIIGSKLNKKRRR